MALSVLLAACGGDSAPTPDELFGATRPLPLTEPAATPPVDLSTATVDVGQVLFDTFDGGSVPLADAEPELISRLFDAITPIDAPAYESVSEAGEWLGPDDVVIGYMDPLGGAWAFPVRVLNFHEIVNDELGGQPVLVSYCPLCASGVVYDRQVDDRLLSFSNTSALYENDLVMVDRETGSYWWQVPGRAIVGELSSTELTALRAETTTWARWTADHPETLTMQRPPGRDYSRDPFATYASRVDLGQTPFPVDPAALADERLTPGTPVLVAEVAGEIRAWSAADDRSRVETVGDLTVEVTTDGIGGTVSVDGVPAAVRTMLWFAAVAAYPEVTLGG